MPDFKFGYGDAYKPCRDAATVTPSDSVDLPFVANCLYVGTQGNVAVITQSGTTLTFTAVVGILPFAVKRVLSTGTTATNIIAGF